MNADKVAGERIAARVAAREQGQAIVELLLEEIENLSDDCREVVFQMLRKTLPAVSPTVVLDRPMTYEETWTFERESMPFGKHANEQIMMIPLDYLLWLEEQPDFRRQLRRYFLSDRMQREQIES